MNKNWSANKTLGVSVTGQPLTKELHFRRILFYISSILTFCSLPLTVFGFKWIFNGFTIFQTIAASAWMTFVFFVFYFKKNKIDEFVFNIKNALYFEQYSASKMRSIILGYGFTVLICLLPFIAAEELGIPSKIEIQGLSQKTIPNENHIPVFFWDYSTFIPMDWLKDRDIILPYEKGPPTKVLSKIYFRNKKTHILELELHGKRPRTFDYTELQNLFDRCSKNPAEKWKPSALSLLYWIRFEAGLLGSQDRSLFHLYYDSGTHLFGIPWTEKNGGRFFFLGTDGSIFQVRCHEPCLATDLLAFVKFPDDPKGSFKQRQEFITNQIKKILAKLNESPKTDLEKKESLETILRIYLASYITLNPTATEAFFHLGKLTKNKDGLANIIRYAKDIKMDKAELTELELQYNSLSY